MNYKRLSMKDAKAIVTDIDNMNDSEFQSLIDNWKHYRTEFHDPVYSEFRSSLIDAFKNSLSESGNRKDYLIDLNVGLCIYRLMPLGNDFSIIDANDDDIWRYISLKVMPDITYMRYPKPAKGDVRINQKRFYSAKRRIWLKTLWWYIHLSWQGTESMTYEVLKYNAVDNINKLFETPGKGYQLSLYRILIKEYAKYAPHKDDDFAAITKLNNVKCISIVPALVPGGEEEYAKQLVAEVCGKDVSDES